MFKGKEIVGSERIVMEKDESAFRLIIRDVRIEDAGEYECAIFNIAGEISSTAQLLVEGK